MIPDWPRAGGEPPASALLRCHPEDFLVREELGFEPSGEGEHVFLYLEKRCLNTADLVSRVSGLAGIPQRDIGYSGMKDRNAVTRQWLSVRMAGRAEPDWRALQERGDIRVLEARRHARKLKRGVHRSNRFTLRLREVTGDLDALQRRLGDVAQAGAPNYFGEQRFGRDGATLARARQWAEGGGSRLSRGRRSLYLSALRSWLFNELLAARVRAGEWNRVLPGDVCVLRGSRSLFECPAVDDDIRARAASGDLGPGLPLWGRGGPGASRERAASLMAGIDGASTVCAFLERQGLALDWRPARLLADDFCWHFCDDGSLQLDFALGAGGYATALLAEFIRYRDASIGEMAQGE